MLPQQFIQVQWVQVLILIFLLWHTAL